MCAHCSRDRRRPNGTVGGASHSVLPCAGIAVKIRRQLPGGPQNRTESAESGSESRTDVDTNLLDRSGSKTVLVRFLYDWLITSDRSLEESNVRIQVERSDIRVTGEPVNTLHDI